MIAACPVFALVCTRCTRLSHAKSSDRRALEAASWDGWQLDPPMCGSCMRAVEVVR